MDKDDSYADDLEKLQKDVANLYAFIKDINKKISNIEGRLAMQRQADKTPPLTLSDPAQPSRLGKSVADWYDELSNKTRYPIADPGQEG